MCKQCGNPECHATPWSEEEKKVADALVEFVNSAKGTDDASEKVAHITQLAATIVGVIPVELQVVMVALFLDEVRHASERKHGRSPVKIVTDPNQMAGTIQAQAIKTDKETLH